MKACFFKEVTGKHAFYIFRGNLLLVKNLNLIVLNEETREIIILLFYTEDATMKQTLNRACPTAQCLASSAREFTWTLQSHFIN